MDCNNYSYVNSRSESTTLAESWTARGNMIYLDRIIDFFGDCYYSVADIFDEIESLTFDFSRLDDGDSERKAYDKAARYYNSFANDEDALPLF